MVIDAGYDVPSLSQHFDWIAIMTYDFHGHWDKQTGHVAPLYYYPGDVYDYFNAVSIIHKIRQFVNLTPPPFSAPHRSAFFDYLKTLFAGIEMCESAISVLSITKFCTINEFFVQI